MFRNKIIAGAVAAAVSLMANAVVAATGPSSSQTPYVTPTAPGWEVTSVLSVGDAAGNGYRMVGIPDGLGAYLDANNNLVVLMNHELGSTSGIARAHGATGAFVSEWVIDKNTLQVMSGADLATSHQVWDTATSSYVAATGTANSFNRLCSADLPAAGAFYNSATGKGTQTRIFMNGEESGNEGRAYGFIATGANKGTAYELPRLGNFSWENSVANPYSGDKTVVVGLDDSTPGQVYIYVGNKTTTGSDLDKAGLTNGNLYGVKTAVATETAAINGAFTLHNFGDVSGKDGATLQADSAAAGVTEFARPEDGHWADADTFYFVTTGANGNTAKLYRLDLNAGLDGGDITMVLDSASLTGTDGAVARSFDNITVGSDGKLVIQEDPGNSSYNAKTWVYDPVTGQTTQIFMSDLARFGSSDGSILATAPFNKDEENSGVIDITDLVKDAPWYVAGRRYYLGDMQAHYGIAGELVQGGQLYMMSAPVPEPSTYAMFLAGLGLLGFGARRRMK